MKITKQLQHSSILIGIIILFLLVLGSGYWYLKENIHKNHLAQINIVVLTIQTKVENLLAQLLHNYTLMQDTIRMKHKDVLEYVQQSQQDPLEVNLEPIFRKINGQYQSPHYQIYITDDTLTIKNTTFANDKNFSLDFAKTTFEKHAKENTIGVSTPLLESTTHKFFSYSDSYIPHTRKILQLSYTYETSNQKFQEIQKFLQQQKNILDVNSYIILNDGFVNRVDLSLKQDKEKLLKVIAKSTIDAKKILEELHTQNLLFKYNADRLTLYFVVDNPILENAKVLYSITFDEKYFHLKLSVLKIIFIFVTLFGVIGIVFLWNLRKKELRLSWQEQFLRSAMHEVQTPISIITLNHEMNTLKSGENVYTKEIGAALQMLEISYSELGYALLESQKEHRVESLVLKTVLQERVAYFQTLANSVEKKILLESTQKSFCVNMSYIELVRLIDNTLSNALKYSQQKSTIYVKIDKNRFCILNKGKMIQNTQKIFQKYYREDVANGGFGLGLFIVQEIAKKYTVKIDVVSQDGINRFCYTFKEVECK